MLNKIEKKGSVMFRYLFVLLFLIVSLNADYKIYVFSSKDKKYCNDHIMQIRHKFKNENFLNENKLNLEKDGKYWAIKVSPISTKQEAKSILAKIKVFYLDAFMKRFQREKKNIKIGIPGSLESRNRNLPRNFSLKENKEETFDIKFDNLSIKDFIPIVSKALNKNILVSTKISGNMDFTSIKPVTKKQLYSLLITTLETKNLTLVDNESGFLEVVKIFDAVKKASFNTNSENSPYQIKSEVIFLQNAYTKDIQSQVRLLISKHGKFHYSKDINAIVIMDYQSNIKSIKVLLDALNAKSLRMIKRVELKNIRIENIETSVKQLSIELFSQGGESEKVSVIPDINHNTVTLIGNKKNVYKLMAEVKKMDIKSSRTSKKLEMVYVKNANAADIVKVLEELISNKNFTQQIKSNQKDIPGNAKADKKPQNTLQGNEEDNKPSITYDSQLNAIMIFGQQEEIDELSSIINKLDVERQQVFVRAKIIEIKKDKASKIGFKYGVTGGIGSSAGLYSFSSLLNGGNIIADGISNLNLLKNLPVLTEGVALGVAMSLLSANGATDILSEPSILCINNEESSIYVGKTKSVISQSTITANTTDLNRNSYSREDIGLTFKLKPRISADNKVTLKIEVIQEDIIPSSEDALPTTTKREVKTTAIVGNAETIIVGGLSKRKGSNTKSKIPILGNVPVLGQLFSHNAKEDEQTFLVILITPYIINHSSELIVLRKELATLENFTQNFANRLNQED